VHNLYRIISGAIHRQKPAGLLKALQSFRGFSPEVSLIRVELLSSAERMLLLIAFGLKGLLFYLVAAFVLSYFLLSSQLPYGTNPLSVAQSDLFSRHALLAQYLLVSGYLILLQIFSRTLFPTLMDLYGSALLNSPMLMFWHQMLIGRAANLFSDKSFIYKGADNE